jgi:hypothetical protein
MTLDLCLLGLIESVVTILPIGQEKKIARRDVISRDVSSYLKLLTASAPSCTLPSERNQCTIIYKNLPHKYQKVPLNQSFITACLLKSYFHTTAFIEI